MSPRRTFLRWHRSIGIAIVALALLSATTGTLLVFREQLAPKKPTVDPVERHVSLEAIRAAGVAAGDGSPATDIGLPQSPTAPYVVWLDDDDETEVYLDGNARVVGTRAGLSGLTRTLFRLHTGELLGPLGTVLTLLTGLGILALGSTGIAMTLWRRRFVRATVAPVVTPDDRAAE
jgi:uncharacterized iron-regulated membrane protein